ncbi:uncharacterized protein LOC131890953 [Tigriopus californicus]|uniref:uncharacterized protein LOC131890953 n=1 Tax=Tigriopus californicus TaxID=6832 RepID=UPI0027DA4880|nr:uncharacterized protein LOC131890953 [Tigriopus californicus]
MLVKCARVFVAFLCFGGFLIQGWELFVKFIGGTTTIAISNLLPENGQLNLPRFSICFDPPTTLGRLSELGLTPMSWSTMQLRTDYNGSVTWPITSKNNTDLFDRSMFSFDEVFKKIRWLNRTVTATDIQNYKMANTMNSGKCFTFLLDETPVTKDSQVLLEMKNVFGNQSGRFRIFLHDRGMELLLINQGWVANKKFVYDVSPGRSVDIAMRKNVFKKLQKLSNADLGCRPDWSSVEYFECIDKHMENITSHFKCRSPFDISLNQSAIAAKKPICASFNDTRSIFLSQRKAFWSKTLSEICPQYCNLVSYSASTSEFNLFGIDETVVFLSFETLVTTLEEEVLVYDLISMISSVGGSMGLFLGFSFLEMAFKLIHALQEHISNIYS